MKIRITLVFKLLIGMAFTSEIHLYCQSPGTFPQVIPPSPIAASFTIYGDYPVSYNTGVPDIQIPLYNLVCGDVEVPISLKYHIGSAKPNQYGDEMSNIGYGWILDVGGIVSRTVFGKQDESDGLLSNRCRDDYDQDDEDDYNTLYEISTGQLDSEYDIFNYNFAGGAGKFLIYKKGSSAYKVTSFPYVPWKWNFSFSGSGTSKLISSIKIKDDKGYNYTFSDIENNQFANSGWFLSQIQSPNNRTINFTYTTRHIYIPSSSYYNYRYDVTDYHVGHNVIGDLCDPELPNLPIINQNYSTNAIGYDTKTIHEINCETGSVVFTLTSNNSLIQYFTVYDQNDNLIRKVSFFRSLFTGQNAYNKLDSIWIEDSNDNPVQKYRFEYNPNSVLNSKYVDYWGWYNGVSNTLYVPQTSIDYYFSGYLWSLEYPSETRTLGDLNRCVDQSKILAQTLKKIYYPTGGYTEFTFEPNQFSGSSPCNNNSLGEGLRIKSIINVDNNNIVSRKSYVYQPGTVLKDRFNSNNYVYLSYSIDGYVADGYDCSPRTILTFRRTRSYNENLSANILDNNIRYSVVEEYFGTTTSNIGKNTYYYSYDNDHIYVSHSEDLVTPDYIVLIGTYHNWANGLLSKMETYKKETGSSYTKVHEKNYEYKLFDDTVFHSLRVFTLTDYPSSITFATTTYTGYEVPQGIRNNSPLIPTPPPFGIYDYNIHSGGYVPTKTTETFYFPEQISSTINNYYESGYKKYLTKTIQDTGTINMITKNLTYPYDYSDNIFKSMADSNRIDHIIEQIDNKNGSIQKTKSFYKDWGNGITAPEYIKSAQNSAAYEERFQYLSYDNKGNIVSAQKSNDMPVTYIWGYNKTYPVAEFSNATYSEINSLSPDVSLLENGNTSEQQRLRTGLPGAQVTFYTYKPLVGMTSKTNPDGVTLQYEYDFFGRLKTIKDNDGRILKTYEYHYKQ